VNVRVSAQNNVASANGFFICVPQVIRCVPNNLCSAVAYLLMCVTLHMTMVSVVPGLRQRRGVLPS